jgi:hypothetical protein
MWKFFSKIAYTLKNRNNINYCMPCSVKQTKLLKYGDEKYNNCEKQKITNLEKYGVSCVMNTNENQEKRKNKQIEKFGSIENYNKFVNEARNKTIIKKYGSLENFNRIKKENIKKTNLKKYGVENPNSSEIVKQHKKESSLEKYGVDNVNKLKWVRDKIKKTCIEKYGKCWNQYKFEYDNNKFDSSWELIYYIYLKDNNVNFIFHPKTNITYEIDGK